MEKQQQEQQDKRGRWDHLADPRHQAKARESIADMRKGRDHAKPKAD